jgi:hypothetical protein
VDGWRVLGPVFLRELLEKSEGLDNGASTGRKPVDARRIEIWYKEQLAELGIAFQS